MTPIAPATHPPPLQFPLYATKVSAGFPSPADDYLETQLDLNDLCVRHKEATFFLWVRGDSMKNANVIDGDLLVVDRSIVPAHLDIVVAVINAEFTVKYLWKRRDEVKLVPANEAYADIDIPTDCDLTVWGVVTHVVHSYGKSVRTGRRK